MMFFIPKIFFMTSLFTSFCYKFFQIFKFLNFNRSVFLKIGRFTAAGFSILAPNRLHNKKIYGIVLAFSFPYHTSLLCTFINGYIINVIDCIFYTLVSHSVILVILYPTKNIEFNFSKFYQRMTTEHEITKRSSVILVMDDNY
jgi:hypothetical protein